MRRTLLSTLASLAILAPAASALAAHPQVDAYAQAGKALASLVRKAHEGALTQEGLRTARQRLESKLDGAIRAAGSDFRAGELEQAFKARADFNQQVIRSTEWEAFGPVPNADFGWDPAAQIAQDGVTFTVKAD